VAPSRVLEMTEAEQSFTFDGLDARPVASVLRGFSAPVVLDQDLSKEERLLLLAHDNDPFNRWEAGRTLARQSLLATITEDSAPDDEWLAALRAVLEDEALEPAYRALMLGLPSHADLASALHDAGKTPDPAAIHQAVEATRDAMAERFAPLLSALYDRHKVDAPYQPNAAQSGKRALTNAALALLTRVQGPERAQAQYDQADNMTQQLSALAALLRAGHGDKALEDFEVQWRDDRLVMDKWFGLQVSQAAPEEAAEVARKLTQHADFNWKNPNRFRAVFGSLAMHHAGFHHESGKGYALLADWLIKLDPVNPQTTARMCSAFQTWRRYDAARQEMIKTQLDRILASPDLSRDTSEMLSRIRGA